MRLVPVDKGDPRISADVWVPDDDPRASRTQLRSLGAETFVAEPPGWRDPKGRWKKQNGKSDDYWTSDEGRVDAAHLYAGDWSVPVNIMLRDGSAPPDTAFDSEKIKNVVQGMDAAIEQDGEDLGRFTYRGFDLSEATPQIQEAIKSGHGTFTDRGFTSTTGSLGVAVSFSDQLGPVHPHPVVMTINVPPGTKGLRTDTPNEAERVLPRGGKFKVTYVEPNRSFHGAKATAVSVDWIPPDA